MKHLALLLIRIYQRTLSFDHGLLKVFYPYGYCRFTPSCSEYAYQAIDKYGILKGVALGTKRILRCNPYVAPKADPLM